MHRYMKKNKSVSHTFCFCYFILKCIKDLQQEVRQAPFNQSIDQSGKQAHNQ